MMYFIISIIWLSIGFFLYTFMLAIQLLSKKEINFDIKYDCLLHQSLITFFGWPIILFVVFLPELKRHL